MRYILLLVVVGLFFGGCKKDKYDTAPSIAFRSFEPAAEGSNYSSPFNSPKLVLEITDAEGDVGLVQGKDTAKIYIKNLFTAKEDSMFMPDFKETAKSNFKATVKVDLFTVMGGRSLPVDQRPYVDTLHFEVYVKDLAKNKSNVLVTDGPFLYYTLP